MVEQNNQVARKLKWLDAKKPYPSSLNVRELRSRSVNEALNTLSIRQPPLGPIYMHSAVQNLKNNGICLPSPINQSTPVVVSTISSQSSSELDTDQGWIIDETMKQVIQTVNQTLLKTTTCHPTSNLKLSNSSQYKTPDNQSPFLNPSDIHKHTTTTPNHFTDQIHLKTALHTPPQIWKKLKKSLWT